MAGVDGRGFTGIDLLAGGVPCPPFSIAGKQLGAGDERDLFPHALRLTAETGPRAVLLENVRGLARPQVRRLPGTGAAAPAGPGVPGLVGPGAGERRRSAAAAAAVRAGGHQAAVGRSFPLAGAIAAAAARRGRDPRGPDGRQGLAGDGGLGAASGRDRADDRGRQQSTAVLTSAPAGRARPGGSWAWTGWASPTTALARPSRPASCRSSPSGWWPGCRAFPIRWEFAGRKTAAYRETGTRSRRRWRGRWARPSRQRCGGQAARPADPDHGAGARRGRLGAGPGTGRRRLEERYGGAPLVGFRPPVHPFPCALAGQREHGPRLAGAVADSAPCAVQGPACSERWSTRLPDFLHRSLRGQQPGRPGAVPARGRRVGHLPSPALT